MTLSSNSCDIAGHNRILYACDVVFFHIYITADISVGQTSNKGQRVVSLLILFNIETVIKDKKGG